MTDRITEIKARLDNYPRVESYENLEAKITIQRHDIRWLIAELEREREKVPDCYCCYSIKNRCDPACSCFKGDRNE